MQYTILGRLQFITILAVLALPFAALLNQPVHAEVNFSSLVIDDNKPNAQPYEGATFPDVNRSINSLGDSFIDSLNSVRTTSNVDCSLENCIALTFDDGPNQLYTPQVLDILKQYQAYGSFFIIGNRISAHPEIVRRTYREGHDVGNHTWSHPMLDKLSPEQINNEYVSTQEAMVRVGVPASTMFRPPYGIHTAASLSTIPTPQMLWNVDPRDWDEKSVDSLVQHVLQESHRGSVVVMHDTSTVTTEALKRIIPELQKNYKLVTLSDMFDLESGDRGLYYGLQ